MKRLVAFVRAMICPVKGCHEHFLILHISPKRHVVVSVYPKWFPPPTPLGSRRGWDRVKGGQIVYGPHCLAWCIDWVQREIDNRQPI